MHGADAQFAKKFAPIITGKVLDVGSFNVNGALRDTLPVTVGVDMQYGDGVDEVVNASDLVAHFGPESFDAVVSAGTLEHIQDWKAAMENMWGVLKPEGVLLLSMACERKTYHGYPHDYHRWPMDRFVKLFGDNTLLGKFDEGPSIGVCVRKVHPLDLSHLPDKVKGGKKGK